MDTNGGSEVMDVIGSGQRLKLIGLARDEKRAVYRGATLARNKYHDIRKGDDSHYCELCNSATEVEVHHIHPMQHGGTNDANNLILLCYKCHKLAHKSFRNGHGCQWPHARTSDNLIRDLRDVEKGEYSLERYRKSEVAIIASRRVVVTTYKDTGTNYPIPEALLDYLLVDRVG